MNVSVLVLFVRIGVGVRVLGEVKGQDFADDTISLLQEEKTDGSKFWTLNVASATVRA